MVLVDFIIDENGDEKPRMKWVEEKHNGDEKARAEFNLKMVKAKIN